MRGNLDQGKVDRANVKKGYLGPAQTGCLEAWSEAGQLAEQHFGCHGAKIAEVFYASAFQAGVDRFLLLDFKRENRGPLPTFVSKRTTFVPNSSLSIERWTCVSEAFSRYLPEGWERDERYRSLSSVKYLICEMLDAMEIGASLLSPMGIPELGEAEPHIPIELRLPLQMYLNSISKIEVTGLVPQRYVTYDQLSRLNVT